MREARSREVLCTSPCIFFCCCSGGSLQRFLSGFEGVTNNCRQPSRNSRSPDSRGRLSFHSNTRLKLKRSTKNRKTKCRLQSTPTLSYYDRTIKYRSTTVCAIHVDSTDGSTWIAQTVVDRYLIVRSKLRWRGSNPFLSTLNNSVEAG